MKILIFGSGFGLYGYLPAIYKISKQIYLNLKYKNFFYSRDDLKPFRRKITWYKDLDKIFKIVDVLIIARRPSDQHNLLKKKLVYKNKIKHLFLEKPLSNTPKRSLLLENIIKKYKKSYSVFYIFKFLPWYKKIKKISKKKNKKISIKWLISNRKSNSWKFAKTKGGGVIRFYGIHFIKMCFDLNFNKILYNKFNKKLSIWNFKIVDKNNNLITFKINSFSKKNLFQIKLENRTIFKHVNPFNKKIIPNIVDPRVKYIKKYILMNLKKKSNNQNNNNFFKLWEKCERIRKKI